jgi:hypothetical protein
MSTPQTDIIKIILNPYHDRLLKPLYIKLHDIFEEIFFNINSIKPIETMLTILPWNTNHLEAHTDLIQYNKMTPHNLIINTFHKIINSEFKNYYHLYTDASKTKNETGFIITHRNDNGLHKIVPFSNIYTAETFAILEVILITLSSNHDKFSS